MAGGSTIQGQPVEGKGTKLAGAGVAGISTEKRGNVEGLEVECEEGQVGKQ